MTTTASLLARSDAVTVRDRRSDRQAPPAVFTSAKGAWCVALDGGRYIDLTASSGAVLLGHADDRVAAAAIDAVTTGAVALADAVTVPLVEVAERLVARFPAAEKVVFFRTGSEATTAAVRLVRAATRRPLILSAGYHGWHDWQLGIQGIRLNSAHRVIHFGYHLGALDSLLDALGDRIGGVIVSPEPTWMSSADLAQMSRSCRAAGVPFILDEVMTGLRFGRAGFNGAGVEADLIVLAKGIANGHSLAAVAGDGELVSAYHTAQIGGTYNREVMPLAAARVVLDETESGAFHRRTGVIGSALRDGIASTLHRSGVPAWVSGPPLMFDIVLPTAGCAAFFFRAMFQRGVHMDPTGTQFVTGAHTDHEVTLVLEAVEESASLITGALDELPEVDERRRREFAYEAFGGVLGDSTEWRADVARIVDEAAGL